MGKALKGGPGQEEGGGRRRRPPQLAQEPVDAVSKSPRLAAGPRPQQTDVLPTSPRPYSALDVGDVLEIITVAVGILQGLVWILLCQELAIRSAVCNIIAWI